MSETETKTETKKITGPCVEISERNGWTSFSVDTGGEHPVRLSTKLEAIIQAARGVGGDVATWTFKESDGNPNPNRPGTFYKNRYLDKVELAGGTDGDKTDTTSSTPEQTTLPIETTGQNVDWDAKERRDYRSRTWAITVSAFTHTIKTEEDPVEVFKRLLPFQTRLYFDVVRELGQPDDDSIPF
jgi:hypothetical protein